MVIRFRLAGIAWVVLALMSPSAPAHEWYLLDFDGTVVDDQSPRSTWRRMWHLKVVEELRNIAQPSPQALGLPDITPVTYRELRRLMPRLARGPGELNWLKPEPLDADVLDPARAAEMIPGYYYVSRDRTFVEYRPAEGSASHLLRVAGDAVKRAEIENENFARDHDRAPGNAERADWAGPAMPLVRRAMAKRGSIERLIIFTASNHLAWEWEALLKFWKAQGVIKHVHGKNRRGERTLPRVLSINDPESLYFGRGSFAARKGQILRAFAADISNVTTGKHFELSPDPTEAARGLQREVHTLIVAEDDPHMLAEVRRRMAELSGEFGIGQNIKFVLFNASVGAEVDDLWPHRWTVFHRRVPRAAEPSEIARWTGCEDLLR